MEIFCGHAGIWSICTFCMTGMRPAGCSKRLSSKAEASEEARRTLRYVEPLSDARTPLGDFFHILLAGQFAVANPVWLIGFLAQPLLPIYFVLAIVPFEPDHLAIAFEGHNMGRDSVKKPVIVAADDGTAGETFQSFLQCAQGIDVKIVGRLVENDEVRPFFQHT